MRGSVRRKGKGGEAESPSLNPVGAPSARKGRNSPMRQFWQNVWQTIRQNRKQTAIVAAAVLALLTVVMVVALALERGDRLKGRWSLDGVTVYEFRGGGSGALVLDTGEYPFRYRTDGDRLTIDFVSESAADRDYTYAIEGKTLVLTSGQQRYEMTRE